MMKKLNKLQHDLEIKSDTLQAIISEEVSVTNVPQIKDTVNPSSTLASSAQLQGQIETHDFNSRIDLGIAQALRQKQEIVKENLQQIKNLEKTSQENYFLGGSSFGPGLN